MKLGGPLRGIFYGIGALAVPVSWSWGYRLGAVGIGVLVLFGISGELLIHLRR